MNLPANEPCVAVAWRNASLHLLDQRRLPAQVVTRHYGSARAVARAIRDMVVRGAPAIGIAAAYAVVLAARGAWQAHAADWRTHLDDDLAMLRAARPTAVNLNWALTQMQEVANGLDPHTGNPEPPLLRAAQAIHDADLAANQTMGELGAELVDTPCAVLTHCNAGALATGGYGTALGVGRRLHQHGRLHRVYVSETRPWLQGSRLTAWELRAEGIPFSLLTEAAAATLMQQKKVAWLTVGADRIAANGDVVNKVGTCGHAIIAQHYGVKVMVVAPLSTLDARLACGHDAPIEYRSGDELTTIAGQRLAPERSEAWNPCFDVTPAALVDMIVTERGTGSPASVAEWCRTETPPVLWPGGDAHHSRDCS